MLSTPSFSELEPREELGADLSDLNPSGIHIGNQTALSVALMQAFEYAVASGFDAFEWFPNRDTSVAGWGEDDLDGETRSHIHNTAVAHSIRLSVHAPWRINPLKPEWQPDLVRSLTFARDLGAAILNIHLYPEEGILAYAKAIAPWAARLGQAGIKLSIENTPQTTPEHCNEIFACLRELADVSVDRFGMCLDLGHANLCDATRNDYLRFIDRLDPQVPIIHVHMHENYGDYDSHLTIFTGPAGKDSAGIKGFLERLRKRNFSGSIILEQWPQPPILLNQARDRLHQMLGNTTAPASPPEPLSRERCAPVRLSGRSEGSYPQQSVAPPTPDAKAKFSGAAALAVAVEAPAPLAEEPCLVPSTPEPLAERELPDEDALVDALAEGNRRSRSWREKLDLIRMLLRDPTRQPTTEQLVYLAIYLRFVGTGAIASLEDGRHFRPGHAARISMEIQDRLAQITSPASALITGKIYAWLPSSDRAFIRPEPLTRIRDIAHRNDIPQQLKREIKLTLQNKLHRCAGPEDLLTSEALLRRITAPGAGYSPAFVEQFKIFHQELKEFFNARSLDERLQAVAGKTTVQEAGLIRSFLAEKRNLAEGIERQLAALERLTELRRCFLAQVEQAPGSKTQELRLADVALEDFCFVLLSRMINHFDFDGASLSVAASGGKGLSVLQVTEQPPSAHQQSHKLAADSTSWDLLLRTLALAVANVSLAGVEPEECQAIVSELEAWRQELDLSDAEHVLRLKATVDRARRLADEYCGQIMTLFPSRVLKLGRALGVAEPAMKAFVEGDIRGHIVFQLSKLVARVSRTIRGLMALPPRDVIVSGRAEGLLVSAESIETFRESSDEHVLALVRGAQGDEEIPRNVVGIVLAHPIPHLSHLGVRARQAGIVFVACDDPAEFTKFERLMGHWVALDASALGVSLQVCARPQSSAAASWMLHDPMSPPGNTVTGNHVMVSAPEASSRQVRVAEARLNPERPLIPLGQVTPENGGNKAAAARKLAQLASDPGAGFRTPQGVVVPFGVMECSLRSAPELETEYRRVLSGIDQLPPAEFRRAAARLRELISHLEVPEEIVRGVIAEFGSGSGPDSQIPGRAACAGAVEQRLAVRSSSNGEDLAEFAGAGLHDSIVNVAPAEAARTVRQVWASLWTERAAWSRRQNGIPHDAAHMAVLIQEMAVPGFSFILHTVNPVSHEQREVYVELTLGLGETLACGGRRGAPYRMVSDKESGETRMLSFANFSRALWPGPDAGLAETVVDYSTVALSRDRAARERLGARLAAIARFVEGAFGGPQEIEGVISSEAIYLVQARAQGRSGARAGH